LFTIRKETKENELIAVTTFILHKHRIFQSLKISVETFMSFISKIQSGYKDITYHNKTHGADVS
jgi:3'5'-cyclic nucleotide phosphodiesterase